MLQSCSQSYDKESQTAIQVIDSALYQNSKFVYWYRVDFGIRGYSECMLAFSESSSKIEGFQDAFFISDYITEIDVKSNEIILKLHYDNYRLIDQKLPRDLEIKIDHDGDPLNSYQFRLNKLKNDK